MQFVLRKPWQGRQGVLEPKPSGSGVLCLSGTGFGKPTLGNADMGLQLDLLKLYYLQSEITDKDLC